LSAAIVAEINHLHELESGATDLFAQAQALADEAEQAEGDAAADLFAQAASARVEAAELERVQQHAADAITAQAEQVEDTTRRAARAGMRAAIEQIEDATAAIKTFGGGYGPGLGLENGALSTKDKIALASQVVDRVGSSRSQPCAVGSPELRCTFNQRGSSTRQMRLPTSSTAATSLMYCRLSWPCSPI
jgi:hypothetical protein